eukprot:TRINITY_DN5628_c0_g1_i2.p1 TRINITY_DN5628_c0_g1~~TRINITY_DN5628_c0_g1_i2.p1  ORF type:complete len:805 (+),score=90.58 TRINITY_DN5628_c0_g1_i2:121-2535(+)
MKSGLRRVAAAVFLLALLVWSCSRSPFGSNPSYGRRLRQDAMPAGDDELEVHVNESSSSSSSSLGDGGSRLGTTLGIPLPDLVLQHFDHVGTYHCFAPKYDGDTRGDDSQAASACGPALPNLVKAVTHLSLEMVEPSPWFPNLDRSTRRQRAQRRDYFVTAALLEVWMFMLLGAGLTFVGNVCNERKASPGGSHRQLAEQESSQLTGDESSEPVEIERGKCTRRLLELAVRAHFALVSCLLLFCLERRSFSYQYGAAWEFYLVWITSGFSYGLLQLLVLLYRGQSRPVAMYPMKMMVAHMPWISERADTVRDLMFAAMALKHGDIQLAVFSFMLLFVCNELFLHSREVEGDLYEAYLPMLNSPPPPVAADRVEASASSNTVQASSSPEDNTILHKISHLHVGFSEDDTLMNKIQSQLGTQLRETLLKQTSAGRLRIAVMEDLPQALLALLFVTRNGYCRYVSGSLSLSVLRVLPSWPFLSRCVTTWLCDAVHAELSKNAHNGNAAKLYGSLKRLRAAKQPICVKEFEGTGFLLLLLWLAMTGGVTIWFTLEVLQPRLDPISVFSVVYAVVFLVVQPLYGGLAPIWELRIEHLVGDAVGDIVLLHGLASVCLYVFVLLPPAVVFSIVEKSFKPMRIFVFLSLAPWLIKDCVESAKGGGTLFNRRRVQPPEALSLMVRLLMQIPCTPEEIIDLGFGPSELHAAGALQLQELMKRCRASSEEWKAEVARLGLEGKVTAKELLEVGCQAKHLCQAGFEAADVLPLGFTAEQMRKSGFKAQQLQLSGVSLTDLQNAGFATCDLQHLASQ